MAAVTIGAVSTINDDSFVRLILGDAYVNMTIENIEKGESMAVYKRGSNIGSFLGVTINNIRLAIISFAVGALCGFGSIYALSYTNLNLL